MINPGHWLIFAGVVLFIYGLAVFFRKIPGPGAFFRDMKKAADEGLYKGYAMRAARQTKKDKVTPNTYGQKKKKGGQK